MLVERENRARGEGKDVELVRERMKYFYVWKDATDEAHGKRRQS